MIFRMIFPLIFAYLPVQHFPPFGYGKIDDDLLVGGFNPSEKILVSWDDYSQHMET